MSTSAPESHSDEASTKPIDLLDDQVRNSGSDFSAPSAVPEHLPEKRETSSPQSLDNYADIGLVRDNSPSFAPSDSQNQDPPEMQGFTVSSKVLCTSIQCPSFAKFVYLCLYMMRV